MYKQKLKGLLIGDFSGKRLMHSFFLIIILVYAGFSLYAFFIAEKVIFQPQPTSYQDSDAIIKLDSDNCVKISAVYLPNPAARYTILFSHGNSEDIGDLFPLLKSIHDLGFSVFSYDYRGYGTSSGTPSEKGAYQDEEAAYTYLVDTLHIRADRIIALGRSLGGAMAIDLASRRQLAGLIVESSFLSAFRVVTQVRLLPFDRFNSISKIKDVHCPVLVIHGRKDEVIPFRHGEKLFQAAKEPKRFFWVDNAHHNDLFFAAGSSYGKALLDFVAFIGKTDDNNADKPNSDLPLRRRDAENGTI